MQPHGSPIRLERPADARSASSSSSAAPWAPGVPAPINYYRALRQQLLGTPSQRQLETQPITTPVLQLHGADDRCILPPSGDDGDRFVDRELEVIPSHGHFLQLEDPVGIGERITTWLTKAGHQRT